jgi:hypothetical protein
MADFYYSGQSCVDNSVIAVLTATTQYNIGDVVNVAFPLPPTNDCFTIFALASSGDTPNASIVSGETSCISCIQNVEGSFDFNECGGTPIPTSLDVNDFNFVPNYGGIYYLTTQNGISGCYEFAGWDPNGSSTDILLTISEDYVECNACEGYNIPTSANTAYTLCTLDCDGNPVELEFPHPVYTNNYGNAVTQLNAVQLGGPNGLNN